MSLKEITKELHSRAEQTPFMRAVFDGTLPLNMWANFTYQKSIFYKVIETQSNKAGLLVDLPGIERASLLTQDYNNMIAGKSVFHEPKSTTLDYVIYLRNLVTANDIMAHLYTWHMGDLFGGQMIKRVINAPHSALDFNNADLLKNNIRVKLSNELGNESKRAFEWAIKLLEDYKL